MKKVATGEYITEVKPLLKKLLSRLLERFEYASILATESKGRLYSASKKNIAIREDAMATERGFCVRVISNGIMAEHSFNEIKEELIGEIFEKICVELENLKRQIPEGINFRRISVPNEEETYFCEATEYEIHPSELGDEKIIDMLKGLVKEALSYDENIKDCEARARYQEYTKLFLSDKKDMTQSVMWTAGTISIYVSKGEIFRDSYTPCSILGGAEIFGEMEKKLKDGCEAALALLNSEHIKPGEYECICAPDVTGMIVHEAFGHGVEMDMFVKDRAQAKDFIGQYVASELITMHDGGKAIPQVASFFFDDEGVEAGDTVIIEKGVLKRGMADSVSADYLGCRPTGNGRRESFSRKAYTRMTNTIFEPGESSVDDMIASVKYGMLLTQASSGMEDPKNWGIQCMVSMAQEIVDGKLTGKVFSPIVLTGYVPDLLKSITMISKDFEAGGTGFCGKGYKEWVKVSDGGPYIKARIHLC